MGKYEKLGIAIQGAGLVSYGHIRAYQKHPRCEIVAIGSRTKTGAEAKCQEMGIDPASVHIYDDFDALLADPDVDALSLCTPHERHAMEGVKAAEAGKHFIVEKPIAMAAGELVAMDAAVEKAGVKTVCGFVLRFNPMVITARALTEEGLLGEILYVQTDYWHNPIHSGYPAHPEASAMMLGGCHAVDLARFLMQSDIVQVSAVEGTADSSQPFATNQAAVVKFANGKIGKVSACVEQWMPYQFNVDLLGTDGGLRDDRFYSRKLSGVTDWITYPTITPNSGLVTHHPFDGEIEHFVDCILNNIESHVNVRDGVNTHLTVFAIDESSKNNGVPVVVNH